MLIKWLHDNPQFLAKELNDSSLIQKLRSHNGDEGKDCLSVIATNATIANKLTRSFSKLNDAFPNLNMRFGWIENEDHSLNTALYSGITMIIGEDKYINRFMKVSKVKTLIMTNRAQNNELHLGFQRHLASHSNPYSLSLGEVRKDLAHAETLVRTANNIEFNMGVMRQEDSGCPSSHTAGLDIYDSCKLIRLAGLSKQLQFLGINTGTDQISEKSADAISLLVWYFIEGQINKEIETMKQKENDIFLVSSEQFQEPIKFVVGHKTGRWWYQHPSTKEYVPCSDKDYQAIAIGSLPDSLVSLSN